MNAARRLIGVIACGVALTGCAAMHRAERPAPVPWDQRLEQLKHESSWQLNGRAAVALGQQGWQASLDWHQSQSDSEVHLAGPFGVGALVIKSTSDGLSLNGAPPSDAVAMQLQDRLGFELPLDDLRYWLLGIPNPDVPFELKRNAQDRAQHLAQAGWSVEYDDYMPNGADLLPKRLVLSRADARVRIAVDRWQISP